MSERSSTTDPAPGSTSLDPAAVCTLPADGLNDRMAWIRSELLPRAIRSERRVDGFVWEFEDAPGLGETLDRLVTLERECCSGIVFEHGGGAGGGRHRLAVRGVDPDAAVFATLHAPPADPFPPRSPTPPRLGARIARAFGFGALASLLVCCVLPTGAAALFGTTVAASISTLDQPAVIVGAALLFGGAFFAWGRRRRAATPTTDPADTDCGPGC